MSFKKVSFYCWALFLLARAAQGSESFKEYARSNYAQVLRAVRSEMAGSLEDSSAFLTRLRLATNSFAQDSKISFEEMKSTYESAQKQANQWGYGERILTEKQELGALVSREGTLSSEEALQKLREAVALPRGSLEKILKRSTKIFSLSIVARRKLTRPQVDPEWFFVAGKAVEADTQSGQIFFESYLAQSTTVKLKYRAEAQKELEDIKKRSEP